MRSRWPLLACLLVLTACFGRSEHDAEAGLDEDSSSGSGGGVGGGGDEGVQRDPGIGADDMVVFEDGGADEAYLEHSWVGGADKFDIQRSDESWVPLSTTHHWNGDSIHIDVRGGASTGDWWAVAIFEPDEELMDLSSYGWMKFHAKTLSPEGSRTLFVILGGLATDPDDPEVQTEVESMKISMELSTTWTEHYLPLGIFIDDDIDLSTIDKVKFSNEHQDPIDAYIDNIRFTHNANPSGGGDVPDAWGPELRLGTTSSGTQSAPSSPPFSIDRVDEVGGTGSPFGARAVASASSGSHTALSWRSGVEPAELPDAFRNPAAVQAWLGVLERDLSVLAQGDHRWHPWLVNLEPGLLGALLEVAPDEDLSRLPAALPGRGSVADLLGAAMARARELLPRAVFGFELLPEVGLGVAGPAGADSPDRAMSAWRWGRLLASLGEGRGQAFFVGKSELDAGYREAVEDDGTGRWGSTQVERYLDWVAAVSRLADLRAVCWRMPAGTSGASNASGDWQDDVAEWYARAPERWASSGVIGLLFGGGLVPRDGLFAPRERWEALSLQTGADGRAPALLHLLDGLPPVALPRLDR